MLLALPLEPLPLQLRLLLPVALQKRLHVREARTRVAARAERGRGAILVVGLGRHPLLAAALARAAERALLLLHRHLLEHSLHHLRQPHLPRLLLRVAARRVRVLARRRRARRAAPPPVHEREGTLHLLDHVLAVLVLVPLHRHRAQVAAPRAT